MEETVQYCDVVAVQQPYLCRPSAATCRPLLCQEESCNECNESSTNSTPFVSAPSSPTKSTPFAYYLARATVLTLSPSSHEAHGMVEYDAVSAPTEAGRTSPSSSSLSEFEFSSRFSEADAWFNPCCNVAPPMSTAEELFHNGKIRPLNTRSCSSASYCTCFSDDLLYDCYHDLRFGDACRPDTDCPSSAAHAERHHQQQQNPLIRKQRFMGHTKPTPASSALEQWKKSKGNYDNGHSRHAEGHHAERVMQIQSLPLAHYRNSKHEGAGHDRRARSLSPLRVFHMDDKMMQARASFESEMHTNTNNSHAVDRGTNMRARRSRKSWTLKELLNMGDNRVHDKRSQHQGIGADRSASAKSRRSAYIGRMEESGGSWKRSLEEEKRHSKSCSRHNEGARSPWNLQRDVEEHGDQYYSVGGSEEGQAEEMKKRNFLAYKKGLLGCLGFTSKLNSIKGLQSCMPY